MGNKSNRKKPEKNTKNTKKHAKKRTQKQKMYAVTVPQANRTYKDTLFRMVFKEKKELLELYNAMNDTAYTDPEELDVVTLENAVYMCVKNDLAFIMEPDINLYEHQSTPCPNIPLRLLIYVADEYQKMVDMDAIYRSTPVKLPVPRFVVFYNGLAEQPERVELPLSDLYEKKPQKPELELTVTMLNINLGKNKKLMEKCRTLHEYAIFVDMVRRYEKETDDLTVAVTRSVDECIEKDILRDFLQKNKKEAILVSLYECNLERAWYFIRESEAERGRDEGMKRGLDEGMKLGVMQKLKEQVGRKLAKGKSAEVIAEELDEELSVVQEVIERLQAEQV